jgi:DNA-directed RNA polymerase beta subunit
VNDYGIICALRTPTADSIIHDTAPENLAKIQHLHDRLFRIPAGAEIVDIYVCINRKNKPLATCKNDVIYQQAEIYRQKLNDYYRAIYRVYQGVVNNGGEISDVFNTLVFTAMNELLTAGERLDGTPIFRKNGVLIPVKNKADIEFIHIDVKYRYRRPIRHGFKLTGRFGNKGVVSKIIPDEECPVDAEGFRADIIIDPVSVFNRMNPGQQYEQFINRGNELLRRRVEEVVRTTNNYQQAFDMMIAWARDVNPNYANLLAEKFSAPNARNDLVNDTIRNGFFMNIVPFQDGIDQRLVLALSDKYGIKASPVSYVIMDEHGNKKRVTTKSPVLIGAMFTLLLNKIPHQRVCGIGYINNFRTAVKSGDKFNSIAPYPITAIRVGEDEIRNIIATSGGEVAATILGMYGNNKEALDRLASMLLNDPNPSRIKNINMPLYEIIQGNNMINVTKHMFSCFGIDITPNKGA